MSHRRPDLVGAAPKCSGIDESRRQHADDRIGFGIQPDRLPCDGRVRRITALPKVRGYHGRGRRARLVVVRCEGPSHHRLDAEQRKEIVGAPRRFYYFWQLSTFAGNVVSLKGGDEGHWCEGLS